MLDLSSLLLSARGPAVNDQILMYVAVCNVGVDMSDFMHLACSVLLVPKFSATLRLLW